MKRIGRFLLAGVLALSLAACATPKQNPTTGFKPGNYTAIKEGNNGEMKIEVEFSESEIKTITILEHQETPGISDPAIEKIPNQIIKGQTLNVETISGATFTSKAILEAVEDCVKQADGDVEALKNKQVAVESPKEEVLKTADVIVIGGGGAGMSAALSAAEKGASVIVLEKTATLGGTTLLSGAYYGSGNQELSKRVDMNDTMTRELEAVLALDFTDEQAKAWQATVQKQYDDYQAANATYMFDSEEYHMLTVYLDGKEIGDPSLIEMICSKSKEGYDWLKDYGYTWSDEVVTAKAGDNAVVEIDVRRARRHKATGDKRPSQLLIDLFVEQSKKVGPNTEILLEVAGEELIVENGKVVGVRAQGADGTPYTITATQGVIIATGGFSSSVELRERFNEYFPHLDERVHSTNTPANTGDGILMAEKVGAQLIDMQEMQLYKLTNYQVGGSDKLVGSFSNILVNKKGERFVNEYGEENDIASTILAQPESMCYVLADGKNNNLKEGKNANGFDIEELVEKGYVLRADSLEELAKQIGADPKTLIATVEQFNQFVDNQNDTQFGRTIFTEADKIQTAPFYASLSIPSIHHTMGGIKINTEAQVLNTENKVISGLYAAGEVVGGFHGKNRLSGNAILEDIVVGKVAGANAALGK